jgi:hypothetical protein
MAIIKKTENKQQMQGCRGPHIQYSTVGMSSHSGNQYGGSSRN